MGLRANSSLYRSAVVREGLLHLVGVKVAVAHQFAAEQENGDLVAEADARLGIAVDVDDVDPQAAGRGERGQFSEHLLAQGASRARIEKKSQWGGESPLLKERTEWAMVSTVCAGTSPTAVT